MATAKGIHVAMADGSTYVVKSLLGKGDSNTKLAKSSGRGYVTYGLSLAPAAESGFEVCPNRSPGCSAACIFTSGYAGIFKSVNVGRVAKTRAWFLNRDEFKEMLIEEIQKAYAKAERNGQNLAIRLNVFSDIPWEKVFPQIITMFPNVQFYDYTKNPTRAIRYAKGEMPHNYHLTFSRSETNERDCVKVLASGCSVTVVFDKKAIPETWNGFKVVNGDETDLRFLDPRGVVVGLYAKGKGRKDASGFVVKTERVPLAMA